MIALNQIRNEIKGILNLSEEFSIDRESNFYNLTKEDAIQNLNLLFNNLKEKKVDEIFFNQTTRYFSNLNNLGASYRNKDANITDANIRKVMLREIRTLIEPIENKYQFTLTQDMPDFDDFLNTGTAQQTQTSNTNQAQTFNHPHDQASVYPMRHNFQHVSNHNINQPIKKATLVQYRNEDYSTNENYDFYRIEIYCNSNTQQSLRDILPSGDVKSATDSSITIEINNNTNHFRNSEKSINIEHLRIRYILKDLIGNITKSLNQALKQSHPTFSSTINTEIDVTDIMRDMAVKLGISSENTHGNTYGYITF